MSQTAPGYELKPLSSQQQRLAELFTRSHRELSQATIVGRLNLAHLRATAGRLSGGAAGGGRARYLSDFQLFSYWVTRAIADFPLLRCTLEKESVLRQYERVNLGVAVRTDGGDLVTALVEGADELGFDAFVDALQARVGEAMRGRDQAKRNMSVVLSYVGGPNLMFGSPLVVAPAVATLLFCAPSPQAGEAAPWAYLSMGFDHRVLNGMDVAHFLEGLNERLAREAAGGVGPAGPRPVRATTAKGLKAALVGHLGAVLGVAADQIDEHESLGVLGIDSVRALALKAFLEDALSTDLPGTLLWHYPTVDALVRFGEGLLPGADGASPASARGVGGDGASPASARGVGGDGASPASGRGAGRDEAGLAAPAPRDAAGRATPAPRGGGEPIAVVGLSLRLPGGADDLESFWSLLRDGVDAVRKGPVPRDGGPQGGEYWGGFIDEVDRFDAAFFRLSPREAELIDPQHRLFLQAAWHAIEDAGYDPGALAGTKTGVYAGVCSYDYAEIVHGRGRPGETAHCLLGTSPSMLANRVSFFFDLRGPSEAVDTACSSSLVALHQAVRAVRQGDCDQAIVGGVNLLLWPRLFEAYADAGMLSPGGRCRTFDARADGYVRGEGVVALLLKPLARAQADGDRIYGLVRGTAMNHGGKANSLTAPNPGAQTELLVSAYESAGVDPASVGYVEAHGTGTPLGDPIEVEALQSAFARLAVRWGGGPSQRRCALGSVKTNIGHLEAAAGLAGLIKLLACLRHRQLPPTLHFERQNPHLNLGDGRFYVVDELQPWGACEGEGGERLPRRAGVSSFGMGGANAHAVVEEYVEPATRREPPRGPWLVVLSARSAEQLGQLVEALRARLVRHPRLDAEALESIAYTSQTGRAPMRERVAFLAHDAAELLRALAGPFSGEAGNVFRGRVAQGKAAARGPGGAVGGRRARQGDDLRDLARRWVEGGDVDWSGLYAVRPRKAELPLYPFARERHWVSEGPPAGAPARTAVLGGAASAAIEGVLYATPEWQTRALPAEGPRHATRLIVLANASPELARRVAALAPSAEIASLERAPAPGDGPSDLDGWFTRNLLTAFGLVKGCLTAKGAEPRGVVVVVCATHPEPSPADRTDWAYAPLAALLKTACLENPGVRGKLVELPGGLAPERAAALLAGELGVAEFLAEEIRYLADETRLWRGLREVSPAALASPGAGVRVRPGGVYLITGGLGGLGLRFARHLGLGRAAKIVLAGRSSPGDAQRGRLDALRASGVDVEYLRGDVGVADDMLRVVAEIKQRHGRLHGVIHAAGVLRDAFLLKKTDDEVRAVLAPKVSGVVNLDRATRREPLDFFVIFSSMTGPLGNVGQADYAAANAFLDEYASYRQGLVREGKRSGKTIAIAWPLWAEGGMGVDAEGVRAFERRLGLSPLRTEAGLVAFDRLLEGACPRLLVLEGDASRLRAQALEGGALRPPVRAAAEPNGAAHAEGGHNGGAGEAVGHGGAARDGDALRQSVLRELKTLLAGVIKIPSSKIDETESFEMYGIDSIMIGQINRVFDEVLGDNLVSKTLFYEYRTLDELADYFVREHREAAARWADPRADRPTDDTSGSQGAAEPLEGTMAMAGPLEGKAGLLAGVAAPLAVGTSEGTTGPWGAATGVAKGAGVPLEGGAPSEAPARGRGQPTMPIAIVGLAGRYPGADDMRQFWDNLKGAKEAIGDVVGRRWGEEHHLADKEEAIRQGKSYGRWGGFLRGFDEFDCLLFNISPREALNIDPQERKFLECCWEAVEDAGYTRASLAGLTVGVYAGVTKTGFDLWRTADGPAKGFFPQTSFSSLANRVSYAFDFHGPSLPVDTMCSASLTAMLLACEHIRGGQCDVALAGGVNLYVHPSSYAYLSRMRMLSDDGKNRSFGRGGNGFVPGEGVGAVVLKRLDRAEADGDHIYGLILGGAINHGGRTSGYTVPNPNAQAALVAAALQNAGVDARTVGYVEAHGTGTELGDPIEIAGLSKAFRAYGDDKQYCAIGSVKSNIGHLEAAAGVAALTKVLLQFEHRTLAPSLHAEAPNPNINFSLSPFQVQTSLAPWRRPVVDGREWPLRAGISSFGAGGSNAHLVVEEYAGGRAAPRDRAARGEPVLVGLSAKTSESLRAYAEKLAAFLRDARRDVDLVDLAYTLGVGREAMEHRAAFVVRDVAELRRALDGHARGEPAPADRAGRWGELAALWRSGGAVDWQRLYENDAPRRLSLPTYAFAKRRLWFDGASGGSAHENGAPANGKSMNGVHVNGIPMNGVHSKNDGDTGEPTSTNRAGRPSAGDDAAAAAPRTRLSNLDEPPASRAPSAPRAGRPKVRLRALDGLAFEQAPAAPPPPSFRVAEGLPAPQAAAPDRSAYARDEIDAIKAELKRQLKALLFLEHADVDEDKKFTDLGLDSIVGVEWARLLGQRFSTKLLATRLYDYPTIADLALFLHQTAGPPPSLEEAAGLPPSLEAATGPSPSLEADRGMAPPGRAANGAAPAAEHGPAKAGGHDVEPVKRVLKKQLAQLLFLDEGELREGDAFLQLGLDSILGVEWVRLINGHFGLKVPTTKLYDHPTLLDLSAFVAGALGAAAASAGTPAASVDLARPAEPRREAEAALRAERAREAEAALRAERAREAEAMRLAERAREAEAMRLAERAREPEATRLCEAARARPSEAERLVERPRPTEAVRGAADAGKVAIVGLSGRFPGARDVDAFWHNLANGVCSVVEVPKSRWSVDEHAAPEGRGKGGLYSKWLGALEGVDEFDPLFFNLSPVEAECMDPQQRLFLQEAWKAIEDAGYSAESLQGVRGGTYLGVMATEYLQLLAKSRRHVGAAQTMLGTSNAISAARLAYFLNLKGPAIALDTACSSSLVAAHLGCQALLAREIDLALVGGVTLYLSVDVYRQMCEAGMLSPRGRCFTFDDGADGFVPAEAVAAVVLKRLEDAVAAGDHIYGVIAGSGINQDGKTNGITAPSARAQGELEREVYRRHGISPESISYVEAHGTGTKLGDPIELDALTTVFREYTPKKRFCAIGSVKANLGHTAAAAGLVGLAKVLLSLKHGKLPPSINFRRGNEHIDFENGPFYVNTALKDWAKPAEGPRRAAVSSFGFSGTNAHLVVEEYVGDGAAGRAWPGALRPQLVPLSAKKPDRLPLMAARLSERLKGEAGRTDLRDVAYTLQTGRQAMEHRVAFVAGDVDELCRQLDAFGAGRGGVEGVVVGQAAKDGDLVRQLYADEDLREGIKKWAAKGKAKQLAELWVRGGDLDWASFYEGSPARRVSLPTYPFVQERYWVPAEAQAEAAAGRAKALHPMVHENVSVFGEQRFAASFDGAEFFLRDHRVGRERVLPGVAQLEMARAAVALSGRTGPVGFRDVTWIEPLVVGERGARVVVALRAEGDDVSYEIRSEAGDAARGATVHGRGRVVPGGTPVGPAEAGRGVRGGVEAAGERAYEAFEARGLEYGPAFRCLERLRCGADEVVADLALPDFLRGDGGYVLHPSVADAALQAAVGFELGGEAGPPRLPFSAQAVEIYAPTPERGYARVRRVEGRGADARLAKFDVEIVDENDAVCVRFESVGLMSSAKREPSPGPAEGGASWGAPDIVYAEPRWLASEPRAVDAEPGALVLLLCDVGERVARALEAGLGVEALRITSAGGGQAEEVRAWFGAGLAHVQALLRRKPSERHTVLALVPAGRELFSAPLAALLKTARLENAKFRPKIVAVEGLAAADAAYLQGLIRRECLDGAGDEEVRYGARGEREVKRLVEIVPAPANGRTGGWSPRPGGVYWVTGGLGGLGAIFARHLAAAGGGAVVLSGRSALDGDRRRALEALGRASSSVEYVRADLGDRDQVARAFAEIKRRHGRLDGVVHCAGVLRDSLLLNKDAAEAAQVFGPKVDGALNLDEVTAGEALDFFALFASFAGVFGNVGQGDYGGANAFLDAFARARNARVGRGERRGRTVSIDWPLWQDGGMRIDGRAEAWLEKSRGLRSLPTELGVRAFDFALGRPGLAQLVVLCGDRGRLAPFFGIDAAARSAAEAPPAAGAPGRGAFARADEARVRAEVIGILADLLKIRRSDIDAETHFEEYGLDSILMMKVLNRLEEAYDGTVDSSALVDHPTAAALAKFLVDEGVAKGPREPAPAAGLPGGAVSARFDTTPARPDAAPSRDTTPARFEVAPGPAEAAVAPPAGASSRPLRAGGERARGGKVAIIGVSCRLPQSPDPETFWDNLAAGRDLITEVPKERWAADAVFSADRAARDKTYTNKAGFVEGLAAFDAEFFGLDDDEAAALDPQQRLALELAQELFDRAGYGRDELAGRDVSVILGAKENNYVRNNYHLMAPRALKRAVVNTIGNMVAARVADFFDLRGAAKTVDTACSSSLVAVHEACQSVLAGEAEMAVAGGVFLLVDPFAHIGFSRAEVLSDDGKSYVFDERAKGFVLGEGAGLVLLKDYDAAVRDGDDISGVILGSAVNNDGKTMGLTVPNQEGQKAVIEAALRRAHVDPDRITYYEAHGTGTMLGDPIEIKAATQAYRQFTQRRQYCALGSVKSNLGHTMMAAGVASLIKVILSLVNQKIPATLNCSRPHPRFRFHESPFYPNTALADWAPEGPRLAAISSFGFGGTNCHMIVGEAV